MPLGAVQDSEAKEPQEQESKPKHQDPPQSSEDRTPRVPTKHNQQSQEEDQTPAEGAPGDEPGEPAQHPGPARVDCETPPFRRRGGPQDKRPEDQGEQSEERPEHRKDSSTATREGAETVGKVS